MGQEDQSRKGRLILMPHSHVSCLFHLVFSTSGRQPAIRDRHHRVLAPDPAQVSKHHERVSSAEEFRKFLMAHAMLP
jgi:hypothetical protein